MKGAGLLVPLKNSVESSMLLEKWWESGEDWAVFVAGGRFWFCNIWGGFRILVSLLRVWGQTRPLSCSPTFSSPISSHETSGLESAGGVVSGVIGFLRLAVLGWATHAGQASTGVGGHVWLAGRAVTSGS
jgi:hypothetical protein